MQGVLLWRWCQARRRSVPGDVQGVALLGSSQADLGLDSEGGRETGRQLPPLCPVLIGGSEGRAGGFLGGLACATGRMGRGSGARV